MIFRDYIKKHNGIFWASEPKNDFSDAYIKVRQKEQRMYGDEALAELPKIANSHPHAAEWKLRQKSAQRFAEYLKKNKQDSDLLEIGCGNGWFTNLCSGHVKSATGIDVNQQELEQAATVFQTKNISFGYWDVFSKNPFKIKFDVIVLNAVAQYFQDVQKLLVCLGSYLNPGGEIHIMDSPFYKPQHIVAARRRTQEYYKNTGVPEMAAHYFHHSTDEIRNFEVLYQPSHNKLKQLFKGKDMPFAWYRK